MSDNSQHLPKHIGIIMDGNRRWAKQHGWEVLRGHQYVSDKVIEPLVLRCIELGVPYLTLWAFSTENWKRDRAEVEGLMNIFRDGLQRNGQRLHEKGVRLNMIGDRSRFPADIQKGIELLLKKTAENKNITVTFALNYGGRDEILRAVNTFVAENGPVEVTAENVAQHLDTSTMPDPDLIIRPGGEQRLSGFLTWQSVYSELYFTEILMPDFSPAELDKAVEEYAKRHRRFGK
jgi:undecaprenyl diphosphate synthase